MNRSESQLSQVEAQSLMSQLIDGEIDPADADRLNTYLENHPDEIEWLESTALMEPNNRNQPIDSDATWKTVHKELQPKQASHSKSAPLLAFPVSFRMLAGAAAIFIVTAILWYNTPNDRASNDSFAMKAQMDIEFLDTDIPDASPIVYTDEESGWTIVWIDSEEPLPEETG